MPRLNDATSAALANWWDLVNDAAANGFTASDALAAASDLANQAGQNLTFNESTAISILYGYAARMQHAADAFQGADLSNSVDASMIGTPPWARTDQEMTAMPIYHAYFTLTSIDADGNVTTEWKTSVFNMQLPATVGDLFDAINDDAMAMSIKYGTQFVSAQPQHLLSV